MCCHVCRNRDNLLQFRFNVKYRFNKNYVILNVFSRLFFDNNQVDNINFKNKLNLNIYYNDLLNLFCSKQIDENIYVLHNILITMLNKFR